MKGINWGTLIFKKSVICLMKVNYTSYNYIHVVQKYMDIAMLCGAALKCTELQAIWCVLLIAALGHIIWSRQCHTMYIQNKNWKTSQTFVKNLHLHMQQTPYPLAHPPSAIPFNAAHSSFVQHSPLLPLISPVP